MSKYTGLLMVFLALGSTWSLKAQKKDDFKNTLGLSAQVYPAGFIPTINYEHFLNGPSSLLFRFGGNFVDRQDFSDVNETEEGSGFGGTIGYRRHFSLTKGKLVAGLNFDIWNLNIDWTDGPSNTPNFGRTRTLFLQPWVEGGYFFKIKNTGSQLGVTLGFGREINAITDGEDVAQGFIGSISLQYIIEL